uniref:Uncharacterized protein n=1 Tax=Arundo donax TaxID=35708 RepID=A0A0A9HDY2_ARUDO
MHTCSLTPNIHELHMPLQIPLAIQAKVNDKIILMQVHRKEHNLMVRFLHWHYYFPPNKFHMVRQKKMSLI